MCVCACLFFFVRRMPPLNLEKIYLEKQQSCRLLFYGCPEGTIVSWPAAGLLLLKINLFEIERGHAPNKKKERNLEVETKKSKKCP